LDQIFNGCYKDKTVLVTGHTGFKGSWLSIWLANLGANVFGISHDIPSIPCNFEVSCVDKAVKDNRLDIRDTLALKDLINQIAPDFIFHLAAQAFVRPSYNSPLETLTINALGSAAILDSLQELGKPISVVMVTSDKVYENQEWEWGYRETDRLGGSDPYSASKAMAELAIKSYVDSFYYEGSNIKIGIARAGNVIGGGDWGVDRIVPDCVKAWALGEVALLRNPNATRPWQHVLEPLSGYLCLGHNLSIEDNDLRGVAFNFGPSAHQNYSVRDLIEEMAIRWDRAKWTDVDQKRGVKEAALLKLNCDRALSLLGWSGVLTFKETIQMTADWYKQYYEQGEASMKEASILQIEQYLEIARGQGMLWAM
jgi:CDP-glucose 4,6-dehydratase